MVVRSNRFRQQANEFTSFFPITDEHRIFSLSFFLTAFLFTIEFSVSWAANSLLLFGASLAQLSLSIFIGYLYFSTSSRLKRGTVQGRLATTLLNSFFLLLLTGYIFLEIYLRFSQPPEIASKYALIAALIALGGNLLLFRLLVQTHFLHWKFGSFHLPVSGVKIFFITVLSGIALIHITKLNVIDTFAALIMGITLFIWAGFTMIDAYWKILEFE